MKKLTKRILSTALCAVQAFTAVSFGSAAYAAGSAEPSVDTIAAGTNHSLVIKKDLSLWAAGSNSSGQLGIGSEKTESSGVKVMDNAIVAEANDNVSFAIDTNGRLYGWGDNSKGQISVETGSATIYTPFKVMENVVSVSAGDTHTVAITADGTAYGWGSNVDGELGFTANIISNKPVKLMENVADAAAGNGFTILVTNDGKVYASGSNESGQLGNSNYDDVNSFRALDETDVIAVEAGNNHTLLLKKDGTVWASGKNDSGQVGYSSRAIVDDFKNIGLSGVTDIFAGGDCSAAVTSSDMMYSWGENKMGQLHNKTSENVTSPELSVKGNVISVAFAENHSLLLKSDGTVKTVGSGLYGELFISGIHSAAKPIKIMKNVAVYSAGEDHAAAIDFDGTLYTWGNNDCGQLGTGNYISLSEPTRVRLDSEAINVWCGNKCTFVQTDENKVYVFGSNKDYMLGISTENEKNCKPIENYYLSDYSDIDIQFGDGFCIAVIGKTVYGWGKNVSSTLVDCPSVVKYPIALSDINSNVDCVAVGDNFCIAVESTGVLYGWGSNSRNQLGSELDSLVRYPEEVVVKDRRTDEQVYFTDITATDTHVIATDVEGRVWVWGDNESGQLGTVDSTIRRPYRLIESAVALDTSDSFSALIDFYGTLYVSGSNKNGALGTGDGKDYTSFTSIAEDVVSVSLGKYFGGYIRDDGTLYCWGDNTYGQVGNGSGGVSDDPKTVINDALCKAVIMAESITLDKTELTIKPKSTAKLTAKVTPTNADIKNVMWISSDEKVATVSNDGTVKAIKNGTVTITAATANGVKAECKVTVTVPVSSFSVSPKSSKTLKIGKSFTFNTKVYPTSAVDKTLLFESSNPEVAKVSSKGKVTALSAGVTKITVTAKTNPEKTRTVTVIVPPKKAKFTSRKATEDGVSFKWNEVENADGYTIYRSTSANGTAKAIASVEEGVKFIDASAKAGKTYYYTIKSYVEYNGKKYYSANSAKYKVKAK